MRISEISVYECIDNRRKAEERGNSLLTGWIVQNLEIHRCIQIIGVDGCFIFSRKNIEFFSNLLKNRLKMPIRGLELENKFPFTPAHAFDTNTENQMDVQFCSIM